jgi:hypothetical protein
MTQNKMVLQGTGRHQEQKKELARNREGRIIYPEDGGRAFIRNVGRLLPDYTAPYPRRQVIFECTSSQPNEGKAERDKRRPVNCGSKKER